MIESYVSADARIPIGPDAGLLLAPVMGGRAAKR